MLRVLILVPLMVAVLLPMHRLPLPGFLREWLVAAALLIAALYCLKGRSRVVVRLDAVMAAFGLLAFAMLAQFFGGLTSGPALAMASGYVLVAALAYQAGWGVSQSPQRESITTDLAGAALLAAIYSALVAACQLSHYSPPFELVYAPSTMGVYGNLAQANHFNDLVWLGVVACGLLMERGVLRSSLGWTTIALLLMFSVLSASRSGFIYGAVGAVLPLLVGRHCNLNIRMRRFGAVVFALYIAVFAVFTWADVAQHFGFGSLLARAQYAGGMDGALAGDVRFAYWGALVSSLRAFGAGAGNFRLEMLQHARIWESAGLTSGGFEHAHNVVLDIGVEYGWVVMLAVIALLICCVVRHRCAKVDATSFWAINTLLVIGTHAMLEYPLYYTYFLIPFCIALGLLAPLRGDSRMWSLPSGLIVVVLLAGCAAMVTGYRHYQQVDSVFFQFQFGKGNTERDKYEAFSELDDVPAYSPFKPYASMIKTMLASDDDIRMGRIDADCDHLARVWLSQASLANCAASNALHGSPVRARVLMTGVCSLAKTNAADLIVQFKRIVMGPVDPVVLADCELIAQTQPVRQTR